MARDVVALVSADDVVAAVRVHADRINDLLRRNGVAEDQALIVSERSIAELIAAVENEPDVVVDLAGWWFGRCLSAIGQEPFGPESETVAAESGTRSVLSGTELEETVRHAIATLPRHERIAVMLRDAYDLPLQAVAVALGRSPAATVELLAQARLRLMTAYDGRPAPDLGSHAGRQPIDLAALATVADGSAEASLALASHRHVSACPICEDLVDRLGRARRLALGMPVLALPDAERESLIEWTRLRADALLPTNDEVLAVAAADSAPTGVPALLVATVLVIAAVLGVGIGVLSRHGDQNAAAAPLPIGSLSPLPSFGPSKTRTPLVTFSPSPSRTKRSLPPIIVRTSRAAPTTSSAQPTTSSPAVISSAPFTTTPAAAATMTIDPTSGPFGTAITVSGSDFEPDTTVTVDYSGGSSTTTTADASGDFTITITASATTPGRYAVTASDGIDTKTRSFEQTS